MSRQPTWPAVLDAVLTSRLRGVHTALPATVVSYDSATKTATVALAVQLELTADVYGAVPPLEDVPVAWPGGGGFVVHAPLTAGDRVLLVFAEESFAHWLATDSVEPPDVLRRHGLHAVAIPVLVSSVAVHASKLTVGGGGETLLGDATATDFVALASLVLSRLDDMQTAIDAHIHISAAAGSPTGPALGIAVPPTPIVWPTDSVAATKVRAK